MSYTWADEPELSATSARTQGDAASAAWRDRKRKRSKEARRELRAEESDLTGSRDLVRGLRRKVPTIPWRVRS